MFRSPSLAFRPVPPLTVPLALVLLSGCAPGCRPLPSHHRRSLSTRAPTSPFSMTTSSSSAQISRSRSMPRSPLPSPPSVTPLDRPLACSPWSSRRLGLVDLIGTPLLRAYMHGFWINAKLYERVCYPLPSPPLFSSPSPLLSVVPRERGKGARVEATRELNHPSLRLGSTTCTYTREASGPNARERAALLVASLHQDHMFHLDGWVL